MLKKVTIAMLAFAIVVIATGDDKPRPIRRQHNTKQATSEMEHKATTNATKRGTSKTVVGYTAGFATVIWLVLIGLQAASPMEMTVSIIQAAVEPSGIMAGIVTGLVTSWIIMHLTGHDDAK